MEGDATLSVQIDEHREAAELRWDGATEIIRVELPERATIEGSKYSQIITKNIILNQR